MQIVLFEVISLINLLEQEIVYWDKKFSIGIILMISMSFDLRPHVPNKNNNIYSK